MKGTILDFSIQTNSGIVSGDDGKRYSFVGAEWKDSAHPAKGMLVDFEPNENLATGVYLISAGGGVPTVFSGQKRPLEYQSLYKSTDDKVFGGVCGGLGHKWNVSPTGLRIVFVILGLVYLIGLIIYVALWIILKGVPTKNVKFAD
jgi:phage shock protein PspC (stress-responsive transcriptional regulator)